MTYDELVDYLKSHDVSREWAMVLVLELDKFNQLVAQCFESRPVPLAVAADYNHTLQVSDYETVRFDKVRFGLPMLSLEEGDLGEGEAVLRIPLTGGQYRVLGTSNSVEYLVEQLVFTEGQPYALELRAPVLSLGLSVTTHGRVEWQWPSVYEASTALGTTNATRAKVAVALESHLKASGAIPRTVYTHTLAQASNALITPQRFHIAVAASGDNDGRYAVNLFASSAQLPEDGYGGAGNVFLLPSDGAHVRRGYDAAVYVAPLIKPLLQPAPLFTEPPAGQPHADGLLSHASLTDSFQEGAFLPLLSVLGGEPCMAIQQWLKPEEALNVVAFGTTRAARLTPVIPDPVIAPQWVVRSLGTTTSGEHPSHQPLLASRPVRLHAYGLGSNPGWALSPNAPGELTKAGTTAVYEIPDDLVDEYRHVRITATGNGSQAQADIVLTPATYTVSFKPPVAQVNQAGRATLTTDRALDDVKVVGGVGTVTVSGTSVAYQAPQDISTGVAVITGEDTFRSGFGLVDLQAPGSAPPSWTAVHKFIVECPQGNSMYSDRHYANGRQMVEVRITIQTGSVTENGQPKYYPLTEKELSTLRLMVRNGSVVSFLGPGESEIPDLGAATPDFAVARTRNRYDFMSSAGTATTWQDDPAQGTRVRSFYLLASPRAGQGGAVDTEFVAQFMDSVNLWHTSKPETQGMVVITAERPPTETEAVYRLERERIAGSEVPEGCTISTPEGEDPYSNCFKSLDYWKLSYRPRQDAAQVTFVDCVLEPQDDQRVGQQSLLRWESELMAEKYVSYTGYTFRPPLAAGDEDNQQWKSLTYDPWLQWLARLRDYPLEYALAPGQEPSPGSLWIALFRRNDFPFWFDREEEYQKDPHVFKTFTARFGTIDWATWTSVPRPLRATLIDRFGNTHTLQIGFPSNTRNQLTVTPVNTVLSQAADTRLHSNAFNFLSFLESGVDPRTGLYTLGVGLPELKANALAGPVLPLRLSFSPMSNRNLGFGLGWDLNLTRFEPDRNRLLSLHSGQQFSVTGSGATPLIEERKLETFHFHEDDSQHWRVVHVDGLVEYLQLMDDVEGQVALPVRMVAPSGHSVSLSYEQYRGHPALKAIAEADGRQLLAIERVSDVVYLRAYPQGQDEVSVFELRLNGFEQVERITLPVEEQSGWSFTYGEKNGYRFVTEVTTPAGAREALRYDDAGHQFPMTAGKPNVPRVTQHAVEPGLGQPAITKRYTYQVEIDGYLTDNNFLGGGQNSIPWADDGLDNLYKADPRYQYGTEQTLLVEGQAIRTTKRTFNAFHLMTLEQTTQNGHTQQSETLYHMVDGLAFRDQPANCQLAKETVTRWSSKAGIRLERVLTDYDHHGNLLAETASTGVITTHVYYPAQGEGTDCPPDPYGFIRQRKQTTVMPVGTGEGDAPVRVQQFTYQAISALEGSDQPAWLAVHTERHSLQGREATPYRTIEQSRYSDPTDGFTLGRMQVQTVVFNDLQVTTGLACRHLAALNSAPAAMHTAYTYSLENSAWLPSSVLKTVSTLTGFDGTSRTINQEHSTLTSQVLLERDDNDIEVRYRYDALQRLVEEIIAPDTENEASRRYTYGLAIAGEPAWQVEEDVQGVQVTTFTDGLGRAVEEWRAEPGMVPRAQAGRRPKKNGTQLYAAVYDALGQRVEETVYDNFSEITSGEWVPQPMVTTFEYDDWGQQRVEKGPDGVRRITETDPVGTGELPQVREWQEASGVEATSAVLTTTQNLFGDPVAVRRLGDDEVDDVTAYGYDGLGRKVRETLPWDASSTRETRFEYDVYDRNVAQILPDDATVERQYASHSEDDLPVCIGVDGIVLGTQVFDGLGRMTAATTGGRERVMTYKDSRTRPETVTTPKGYLIEYDYLPRLGEEPVLRRTNAEEIYRYDERTARLMACEKDAVEVMSRTYFTNGQLQTETRRLDGQEYGMQYHYSVGKRLLRYTDVTDSTQRYSYDGAGRLKKSEVGRLIPALVTQQGGQRVLKGQAQHLHEEHFEPELTTTLTYDALGRPETVRTVEGQGSESCSLTTTLVYDSLGREEERRFDINGVESVLAQKYDQADCIFERTLHEGGEELRKERFEYDPRGHLSWYECSGPECPIDPYGKQIRAQLFELDALDNHTYVTTSWDEEVTARLREVHSALRKGATVDTLRNALKGAGGSNIAEYRYDNQDPVQLTSILNHHEDYPAEILLNYDEDGNLVLDDAGRTLRYDVLGRLESVSGASGEPASHYQYDPSDIISGRRDDVANEHRFYQAGQLATLVQGEQHTAIVRAGDHLVAERSTGEPITPSAHANRAHSSRGV